MTGQPMCQRDYRHPPHTYVDATGEDQQCAGVYLRGRTAAELVAAKPDLAEVGTVPAINSLGVMSA